MDETVVGLLNTLISTSTVIVVDGHFLITFTLQFYIYHLMSFMDLFCFHVFLLNGAADLLVHTVWTVDRFDWLLY